MIGEDEILAAEYAEAARFFADHGILPIEVRRQQLTAVLDGEQSKRFEGLEAKAKGLETEIQNLPAVERLNGLFQLGGKFDPQTFPQKGEFKIIRPAFHTRFQHSELLAEIAKVAGVKLGLSDREITAMTCAGWLHDIGHAAFSHTSERVLSEHGVPDHEERTLETLSKPEFQDFFKKYGVEPGEVADLIQEKGHLGNLQSAFDTLSYIEVDSQMFQKPRYENSGAEFIADLEGVADVNGQTALVVKNPELWQDLLETRAQMMKEFYYHPISRRCANAWQQLLRIAIKNGFMTAEALKNGTDDEIRFKIQSLVQKDAGAAKMSGRTETAPHLKDYLDLYELSLGFYDEKKWEQKVFATKTEAENFLFNQPSARIEKSFIITPFDFTKKTLTVAKRNSDGILEKNVLKCKLPLNEENKQFILYLPSAL